MPPNHYETLGLKRGAAAADIKRAYRELAKRYHPDTSKAADAESRFAAIASAYEVLSDRDKRRAYDAALDHAPAAGGGENGRPAGSRRAHYTWTNIATEQSPAPNGARTELDEMYDTFFNKSVGPRPGGMKNRTRRAS